MSGGLQAACGEGRVDSMPTASAPSALSACPAKPCSYSQRPFSPLYLQRPQQARRTGGIGVREAVGRQRKWQEPGLRKMLWVSLGSESVIKM